MTNPIAAVRAFIRDLGPVEQAQVVASTAVVVSMTTIISAMAVTGQAPRLMDFISILTVGTIGFVSVYFSLHYSRQLDEQRRQLLALNTIAEAVNQVVELDYVLQTALTRITDLLGLQFGWIYMLEGKTLGLKTSRGTRIDFLEQSGLGTDARVEWLNKPRVRWERLGTGDAPGAFKDLDIRFWASIPLRTKESISGALVVAGRDVEMFSAKQAELMEAFGNQISVALTNAQLFEQLKRSERRYADLFEHAPDLYFSIDRRHVILGCNTTGAGMLGKVQNEVLGRTFADLFVPERRQAIEAMVERMFAEGKTLKDVEEQMVRENGQAFYVNLNSSLETDERGAIVNARIVARDITDRKQMEGALLHAQKIDSIGNLAGGIAHDFNNILAAVLGSASIMRRRLTEKAPLAKYVDIIESSARRGSSLTRQLLTFARKTETLVRPVDINGLIEETLQLFQRSVTKEIVVETALTAETAMVNGDDGQIQQALLNLFLNARDAMPEGGRLRVSTSVLLADAHTISRFSSVTPGPFVRITVADTGRGISREIQTRVFEPFFTTKDHGTGLGLSVVYGVVQSHGGFIDLDSDVGQGATFSLYLPRTTMLAREAARKRRQRLPRGSEQILIVDDEVSVCEIARDMLQGLGYTVYVMNDGRAGVDFYRTHQASLDLVLLDVNMPVMGGKEAFDLLRAVNPGLRIMIVTGYGKETVETSKFTSGVSGFMQKPFQLETLALKVREVLDQPVAASSSIV
jgi:PAS domain S-box-containing protein